jgi:hypothetical protein
MNQDLRRKLNRITNILWAGGVTNPVTYIEQISYLIYLKLLDEEESSRELKARLLGKQTNGNGEAALSQTGRTLPLDQVALQERCRAAGFRARPCFPIHGFAGEGRAADRGILQRRGA